MDKAESLGAVHTHTHTHTHGDLPSEKKKRESNLELMRIIMMLLIIAHHYVVNSGITDLYDFSNITGNMLFLQCIGFSGKIMINCFILITGYFSIKGKFSFEKVIRLYLQIKFYKIIIYIIFIIFEIDTFSIKESIKTIFNIAYGVNIGFTATFFLLYLLIPFINILINKLNKKQYSILLCILLLYFTIISTFSFANDTFNEISWYIVVYMIGGYIRTFPSKYNNNKKLWFAITILCIICCIATILVIDITKLNAKINPYFFIANAHKLLAVLTSISMFMMFKNINIKYNKFINTLASTTLGVLLIHAGSDATRRFVWEQVFNVKGQYYSQSLYIHAFLTIATIYIVCVIIELLRIKLIEKPFFRMLKNNSKFNKLSNYIDNSVNM